VHYRVEIHAPLQRLSRVDILSGGEGGPDLALGGVQGARVVREVEEAGGEGRSDGVGAGGDEEDGVGEELGGGEAGAGFGVARVEQEVQHVFSRGLVGGEGGAFGGGFVGELGSAVFDEADVVADRLAADEGHEFGVHERCEEPGEGEEGELGGWEG